MNTIHITKHHKCEIYWLQEAGADHPFAYVERVGAQWWLGGAPHIAGYFATRSKAIAAAV